MGARSRTLRMEVISARLGLAEGFTSCTHWWREVAADERRTDGRLCGLKRELMPGTCRELAGNSPPERGV